MCVSWPPTFLELATTLKHLGAKWLPGKKVNFTPCVVLYFQEINLAWDEVQSLVPKRDDLLKNEKGRQERILYDAYSLQRIQFHSLSELTIQDLVVNDSVVHHIVV